MTYHLNSTEARSHARSNLVIFDEVNTLMRKVIAASDAGDYELTVDSGTVMTQSTPDIVVTGTVSNPTVNAGDTLSIGGNTITLGTSGTNLNAVVADINDANITGVVASKNSLNQLVITYTPSQANWSLTIGSGTANTALGLNAITATPSNPASSDYFNVWNGTTVDRKLDDEMQRVIKYFTNLGYNIVRMNNTTTTNTFKWVIYW